MAFLAFALGILLLVAGAGGLLASVNLLPTEMGMLYAACGTAAACAGVVTLAIGALIRRVDSVAAALGPPRKTDAGRAAAAAEAAAAAREAELRLAALSAVAAATAAPVVAPPAAASVVAAAAPEPAVEPVPAFAEVEAAVDEGAVDEDRAGGPPAIAEAERAPAEPESQPRQVGRYSAGGATYTIFSDGSIEAETENGAFKFASMAEFKRYIAGRRG